VNISSHASEKAVIGASLLDKTALMSVVDKLPPEAFDDVRHEVAWQTMRQMASDNRPVDLLTVCGALADDGKLDQAGGAVYLTQMCENVPTIVNVEQYAAIVAEKHRRRRMVAAARQIERLAQDEGGDIGQQQAEAEAAVFSLSDVASDTIRQYGEISTTRWERLLDSRHDKGVAGLETGFKDLDAVLGGLQPSDLIIIAGRPGEGKTALAQCISENIAKRNKKVLFFSLEMSGEAIIDRAVCAEAGVDGRKIRARVASTQEWEAAHEAAYRIATLPMWIDDDGSATTLEIASRARRHKAKHGLDLIAIDYLQLITDRGEKGENRNLIVGAMARRIKAMAKELKVPVILLSQLNRDAEKTRPNKSMLRDSGEIEAVADVVMFVWTPDANQPTREIVIDKHKNGPTGIVTLYFNANRTKFGNYTERGDITPWTATTT
jgi:replicative DNA helicase